MIRNLLKRGMRNAAIRLYREQSGADFTQALAYLRPLEDTIAKEARAEAESQALKIWFPRHRKSFFSIPADQELVEGPLTIYNIDGDSLKTSSEALTPFSVAPAIAKRHLGGTWGEPAQPPAAERVFRGKTITTSDWHWVAEQVLEDTRDLLTASQIKSVEQDLGAGEHLLAVEFIMQFLDENLPHLDQRTFHLLSQALVAMNQWPLEKEHWLETAL